MSERAEEIRKAIEEAKPYLEKARKAGFLTSEGILACVKTVVGLIVAFWSAASGHWWTSIVALVIVGAVVVGYNWLRGSLKKNLGTIVGAMLAALGEIAKQEIEKRQKN